MNKSELFSKFKSINKNDSILLLTHNDMDGAGSPILLEVLGFTNVKTYHLSNNYMSESIVKNVTGPYAKYYDHIIAVDISANEKDCEIINKSPNKDKLMIFDHHNTAAHLNNYSFGVMYGDMISDSFRTKYYKPEDLSKAHTSGTALFYDYLESKGITDSIKNLTPGFVNFNWGIIPDFVQKVSGYDTWDWHDLLNEDQAYKDLDMVEEIYGLDIFKEVMINKLKNGYDLISNEEKLLLRIENSKIDTYLKGARKNYKVGTVELNGRDYSICMYTGGKYIGEVFEDMKTEHPEVELYLINSGMHMSLRTDKEGIDVGAIAKSVSKNGGGHIGAAGFKVDDEMQIDYISRALGSEVELIDEEERSWSF